MRSAQYDKHAYNEGRLSFSKGIPFSDCPYLFCRVGVDQPQFEQHYRKKLDGWSYGWIDASEQDGGRGE